MTAKKKRTTTKKTRPKHNPVRLGMLSESIGCAMSTLHRSWADADDVCPAAKLEIGKAMERLRGASQLVSNAIASYSLADPSGTE